MPDGGVEAAQLAEAAENSEPSEDDTGNPLPNLLENIVGYPLSLFIISQIISIKSSQVDKL